PSARGRSTPAKHQATNSNDQTSTKCQSTKPCAAWFDLFECSFWNLFDIWFLFFGAYECRLRRCYFQANDGTDENEGCVAGAGGHRSAHRDECCRSSGGSEQLGCKTPGN